MPPAMSTICGVQWPAMKTGSNHSMAAIGTRSALRTARRTASTRARWRAMRSRAALRESVSWAIVRTSPKDSPSVCGSSATTRGRLAIVSATARTSSMLTAQTGHSSWVTMRSGSSSRRRCASSS